MLATGGRARRLSLAGADSANVHYVRSINDTLRLQEQFRPGRRVLIIGGGYIGLEVASMGIKFGLQVTLIEMLPRVLARITASEVSAFYERVHRSRGVEIRTGVGVHALQGGVLVDTVVLSDGSKLSADVVVVGIGLLPNTELAEAAGLEVSNGISVNAYTQTTDPAVYSIGDCCSHENTFLGRRVRLESVPNAVEQAHVCAAAICGKPIQYSAVPWFWSDQYDLKLQMAGLSEGYDQIVIRGEMSNESFCSFYLSQGVIIAADAVNRPQEFMVARKLVAQRVRTTAEQLTDESVPLKALIPACSP